jgi:hypothetical protein
MKKIMQHVLNKPDRKVNINEDTSDKDTAASGSSLATHPIPSLARMSANLSRKSIGAHSSTSEAPKVGSHMHPLHLSCSCTVVPRWSQPPTPRAAGCL